MITTRDLKVGDYISFNYSSKGIVKCINGIKGNCKRNHLNGCCVKKEDKVNGGGCNDYWVLCEYPGGGETYNNLKIIGETNPNNKIVVRAL